MVPAVTGRLPGSMPARTLYAQRLPPSSNYSVQNGS